MRPRRTGSRSRPLSSLLLALLAAAAMAAAVACSGSDDPDTATGASTSAPGRAVVDPGGPTTTRGLTTTVANRFEFVDYQTSGGIAGVSKGLKVWPDGRAQCSRNTEKVDFSVPAATVTELRSALEAANLAALPPVNGSQTPDAVASRVIFGGQSVRYFSGSMPAALGPAVAILDRILARGCP